MNLEKLRLAEANFLQQYPGGFNHPDMVAIGKKHRVDKMSELAADVLAKPRFKQQGLLLENLVKIVSRSSMVSMFEKPKFRDLVKALGPADRRALTNGFKQLLHGKQEAGFNDVLRVLTDGRLAKWSLITICLVYYDPLHEVFVKPTTAKGIIHQFELQHLTYQPRPTWAFYKTFRAVINDMKSRVDPSLSPNNAAFTGFLMMSL